MSLMSKGPPLPPEVAAELKAVLSHGVGGRLNLKITREWFERMAEREGDLEIGAGSAQPFTSAAADPVTSRSPSPEHMRMALIMCAETFRYYARSHREKGTPEGDEKAKRNDDMAAMCQRAIGRSQDGTAGQTLGPGNPQNPPSPIKTGADHG